MTKPIRLDKILIDRKIVENKEQAHCYIRNGRVFVNGMMSTNINSLVASNISIKLDLKEKKKWVSRGAFKLIKALEVFCVEIKNKICLDVGASTGGFTEVLLTKEPKHVYSVDVGYGQLAWNLQIDKRVTVLDRTNAVFLTTDMLNNQKIDIIVSDASFISIKKLLNPLENLLTNDGEMIVLLKPQFEADKGDLSKGVVYEPKIHCKIIGDTISFIDDSTFLKLTNITYSPIRGPEGNIEFLLHLNKKQSKMDFSSDINIDTIVKNAHRNT